MKTSSNFVLFTTMIISTVSVMNSSNWMNMWVCLEINMMSFIPLMYNQKNMFMSQSMMMYFLIQSMSSMMFISFILMNNFLIKNQELIKMSIMGMMMIKMGMPPMHTWFIQIMSKMSWMTCLILMTWQKLSPMYILMTIIKINNKTMMMVYISTLTGAILGLNQTSIKKIMAYSSINHMGWMMACLMMNKKSWMMYLLMYSMIMTMACYMFNMNNMIYINQMNNYSFKMTDKIMILTLMLSMGGVPPFLGFLMKWMAIQYMIPSNEILMIIIMTTSSLITLSYYLRTISSMNLTLHHSQKWMLLSPNTLKIKSMMIINMILPLMIMFFNFF